MDQIVQLLPEIPVACILALLFLIAPTIAAILYLAYRFFSYQLAPTILAAVVHTHTLTTLPQNLPNN